MVTSIAQTRRYRSGHAFEDEIETTCLLYRMQKKAVIARCHPKTIGPPGKMRYAKGKNGVDFLGEVAGPGVLVGQPIAFDAKVCHAASWKAKAEEREQAQFLLDFRAAGGLAFFLIANRKARVAYFVTDLAAAFYGERIPLNNSKAGVLTHLCRHTKYGPLAGIEGFGWPFLDIIKWSALERPTKGTP